MRKDPKFEVYSCATAERLPRGVRHARKDTAGRWAKPVRFEETVRRMYADGYRVFLEVGPRGLTAAAVAECRSAGIRPVMLTGASLSAAVSIARRVGLITDPDQAMEGTQVAAMSDAELKEAVEPSLIGGFVIQMDDYFLDDSILYKFNKLKQEFSQNNFQVQF
jgi:malonyl CoA-acyl carrier protein transacylase